MRARGNGGLRTEPNLGNASRWSGAVRVTHHSPGISVLHPPYAEKCGPAAIQRLVLALLLLPSLAAAAQAQEIKPPEFVAVRVGFADRYKVGVWMPIEVTLRGGSSRTTGRVRATVSDSDGLNCSFDAPEPPSQVLPGEETKVLLYVRFGHESARARTGVARRAQDAGRENVQFLPVCSGGPIPRRAPWRTTAHRFGGKKPARLRKGRAGLEQRKRTERGRGRRWSCPAAHAMGGLRRRRHRRDLHQQAGSPLQRSSAAERPHRGPGAMGPHGRHAGALRRIARRGGPARRLAAGEVRPRALRKDRAPARAGHQGLGNLCRQQPQSDSSAQAGRESGTAHGPAHRRAGQDRGPR